MLIQLQSHHLAIQKLELELIAVVYFFPLQFLSYFCSPFRRSLEGICSLHATLLFHEPFTAVSGRCQSLHGRSMVAKSPQQFNSLHSAIAPRGSGRCRGCRDGWRRRQHGHAGGRRPRSSRCASRHSSGVPGSGTTTRNRSPALGISSGTCR